MTDWISSLMPHLVAAPILLPMLTAASMLLLGERAAGTKGWIGIASCLAGVLVAVMLLLSVKHGQGTASIGVYLPGNWQVPFGIVLVADRLSAMMLLMTSVIGLCAMLFARAGWDKAGVHFHPLFQLQLMGLNGAFLTADLFNLFVFFEIMLTASYGLLLHGSGWPRVRAGLHYVGLNLFASLLFLLGAALLFGVTGTLNMADMAAKVPLVPSYDRGLLHAGATLLAMAFLAKAAIFPFNFWLPPAYSAASPPIAALFTVMTKVGLYSILRLWTLLFPASATGSALFGSEVPIWFGLFTLAFGSVGMLASQHLGRLAGFSVLVSSGTLLAAYGFGWASLTGGALYYMMSSTLALCALFLVSDLIARAREEEEPVPRYDPDEESLPFSLEGLEPPRDTNLDEHEQPLFGRAIPGSVALLGIGFIVCALLIAGLPPLSGFIGKFAMLSTVLNPAGLGAIHGPIRFAAWVLLALLILSGLFAAIAYSRAGIRVFWAPQSRPAPVLRVVEVLPIALLFTLSVLLVLRAGPVQRYTAVTAEHLHVPRAYVEAVQQATIRPGPTSRAAAPVPQPAASHAAAAVLAGGNRR